MVEIGIIIAFIIAMCLIVCAILSIPWQTWLIIIITGYVLGTVLVPFLGPATAGIVLITCVVMGILSLFSSGDKDR
ncbi:MAG: hypothetical protein DRP56_08215 [Planctomycetota bacterium]|nr:MAG: hypothetical protein DRP56_08215 [Planctomycetota bacterium]